MSDLPREVVIDGVRYVPARALQPAIESFRNALLDVFWGEGYRPDRDDPGETLSIRIFDDGDGEPFNKFMDDLIAKLALASEEEKG